MKKSNNRAQRQSKLAAKARKLQKQEMHQRACDEREYMRNQRLDQYRQQRYRTPAPIFQDLSMRNQPMGSGILDLLGPALVGYARNTDYNSIERRILQDMGDLMPVLHIDDIRPSGKPIKLNQMKSIEDLSNTIDLKAEEIK